MSREVVKSWKSDMSRSDNSLAKERQRWQADAPIFRDRDGKMRGGLDLWWRAQPIAHETCEYNPVRIVEILYIVDTRSWCDYWRLSAFPVQEQERWIRCLLLNSIFNFITFSHLFSICTVVAKLLSVFFFVNAEFSTFSIVWRVTLFIL